jgi:hypothetical protein
MTAPDELNRAVKALTDMRDAARDGTPVTDPNEWEFDELTRILAAFHFLLSERAELLAAVERMRGALVGINELARDRLALIPPGLVHGGVLGELLLEILARAVLTTGEDQ